MLDPARGAGARSASSLPPVRWFGVFCCLLLAIGLLLTIQFLAWTRPRHDAIEGVQGRYFIPVALMSVALVGNSRSLVLERVGSVLIVGGLLLVDVAVVPLVVARHFTIAACHGGSTGVLRPGARDRQAAGGTVSPTALFTLAAASVPRIEP